jgi:glycosyltransferase involved in cell wall biosynthesis
MAVAAQLAAECGEPEKVNIIHNGIELGSVSDTAARAIRRGELGIPNNAFVIVTVANLIPYKGHSDLLEALSKLEGSLSQPWRLLLVGRDEGHGAVLKAQAVALRLSDNVQWLGERRNARELLAAADIAVLPSHEEGFSNSLLEKMAAGLPVVATRVGGNVDAVVQGETGLLVPPHDPAALGRAILTLHEDAIARSSLGLAGRKRVEQLFSIQACVKRYLDLYDSVAEQREGPLDSVVRRRALFC